MTIALLGFASPYEVFVSRVWTLGARQFAAFQTNGSLLDTGRHRKFPCVLVGAQMRCSFHEFGPDGQGGFCSFQIQFAVIVKPDPHHAEKLGREPGEPSIVRRTRFAPRGEREPARTHSRRRSCSHHFLQHAYHEPVDSGIERLACAFKGCLRRTGRQRDAEDIPKTGDCLRFYPFSAVGEYRVRARHFKRSHLVRAEGDRRSGLNLVIQARAARHLDYGVVADTLRNLNRRNVIRFGKSLPQRQRAKDFPAVVARLVGLAGKPEGGGRVVYRGGWSINVFGAGNGRVQSRRINERLENGSGGPLGKNSIQLAPIVIAAADDGFYFTGVRIERDQGYFGSWTRLAWPLCK
jgi:hypothetical protein